MSELARHIKIWRFHEAPVELKELSSHGGDEDWLVMIPPDWGDEPPAFLEQSRSFGPCDVSEHQHWSGATILIAAHA